MTRCSALRKTRTCVRAMAQLSATHGRHALASRYGTPPIPAITICSMTLRLTPRRSFIASTLDNHPHMLRLMNGLAARGAADVVLARPRGALAAEERAQREVPAQRLCARSACAVPLRVRHLLTQSVITLPVCSGSIDEPKEEPSASGTCIRGHGTHVSLFRSQPRPCRAHVSFALLATISSLGGIRRRRFPPCHPDQPRQASKPQSRQRVPRMSPRAGTAHSPTRSYTRAAPAYAKRHSSKTRSGAVPV